MEGRSEMSRARSQPGGLSIQWYENRLRSSQRGGGGGGAGQGLQGPAGESASRPWSLPGAKPDWKVRCGWHVEGEGSGAGL